MLGSMRYGVFSGNVHNGQMDKRCLIKLGAKSVDVFGSWGEAETAMGNSAIDFALVDDCVADASCTQCISRLRRFAERSIPVMIVTGDRRKEVVMDCIAMGCGGYVLRPYSVDTLGRHLRAALNSVQPDEVEKEMLTEAMSLISSGQFDEALESLEELVEDENPADEFFRKGMRYLAEEKFGKAIIAFNKVIAINEMYAEAYKGMAEAHKGKGNDDKYKEFLTKAADIFAVQNRLDEAKQTFVEILRSEPDALNPFNRLGMKLRKEGNYDGAVRAYNQACELTPDDANLYYNMARAYVFSGNCEEALTCVNKSIELDPEEHALALRDQIRKQCRLELERKEREKPSDRVLIDMAD